VNLGHATAADVRGLIAIVQETVWQKFSQRLEPEIGLIGEF
jgi:UDP-N-acetylmuramate dehydrogenase